MVEMSSPPPQFYPWCRCNFEYIYCRFADILFRFRLKALILLLLTIHSLAMISVAVAALGQGAGEANICKFIS